MCGRSICLLLYTVAPTLCGVLGDGQGTKVVKGSFELCRSIEGFQGKPWEGPIVQLYIKSAVQPWRINGDSAGLNAHGVAGRAMAFDPCIHEDRFGEFKFPHNPLLV